jgi:hypothetical protein
MFKPFPRVSIYESRPNLPALTLASRSLLRPFQWLELFLSNRSHLTSTFSQLFTFIKAQFSRLHQLLRNQYSWIPQHFPALILPAICTDVAKQGHLTHEFLLFSTLSPFTLYSHNKLFSLSGLRAVTTDRFFEMFLYDWHHGFSFSSLSVLSLWNVSHLITVSPIKLATNFLVCETSFQVGPATTAGRTANILRRDTPFLPQ